MVGTLARGDDGRQDRDLDLDRLATIGRYAEQWLRFGGHVTTLDRVLTDVSLDVSRTMPPDIFGAIVGLADGWGEWRWRIRLNDQLPIAARNAALGHEYWHYFQPSLREGDEAFCQPYGELPPLEREAHVGGSLWTVRFARVERLALGDTETAAEIATEIQVPKTYVLLRNAAAVLLGEKAGSGRAARALVNSALLEHQVWMSKIAEYLAMKAGRPVA